RRCGCRRRTGIVPLVLARGPRGNKRATMHRAPARSPPSAACRGSPRIPATAHRRAWLPDAARAENRALAPPSCVEYGGLSCCITRGASGQYGENAVIVYLIILRPAIVLQAVGVPMRRFLLILAGLAVLGIAA